MTARRAPAKRSAGKEAQLAFDALYIEGGLISPDWLTRIAQTAADGQSEADYRIPKGLNLRDEIGRYFRIAQAHWADFYAAFNALKNSSLSPNSSHALSNNAEAAVLIAQRFVSALLRDAFGFTSLAPVAPVTLADRPYPIGAAALDGRVPVLIAPAGLGLDTLAPAFGDGSRRRSAFGLLQEYLNAAEGSLWGLGCDGLTLRIARDNASLTRPAWIEADLARIFTESRFPDFTALWLLCHETRFGRADQPVADCALEAWRTAGREQGTRAREHLRTGVEAALVELGGGFLSHPENTALRAALHRGDLTPAAYFQQLLRLVYRLIFLITVEERELLHPVGSDPAALRLYAEGYGLRRLRDRSVRRSAHDRHHDLWEATKIVFRGLASGQPILGLPALAGLFSVEQCPHIDGARLENRALLLAVFRLGWLREASGLSRVNWRDMGPEELGSVYESLLELVPQICDDGRRFAFAQGAETRGNARKTTGSYYTPDSLVQVLLDSALEPVIQRTLAAHPADPVPALLSLSIVDPACGSGHFLLAAARRLAVHVARCQVGGTPSAADYRHALRQVVGHCIYGVDLNPMAVELCKVSLWMEAVDPGLPLSFLDSHIQHGNALLGATPALLEGGIPDAAWDPIEGDDKKTASALKKRNKAAERGQRGLDALWSRPAADESATLTRAVADLEAASDADVSAVKKKESTWHGILESSAFRHQRLVADAWCAAFVWPKTPGPDAESAPTNDLWRQLRDGQGTPPAHTVEITDRLARQYHFLHWHLAFPHVFQKGGFDVVLGNPPWERVKLQEQEFFASRSPEIAEAANAAARKKLIATLPHTDPTLWHDWCAASREAEGQSHFVRQSGRYPLCGKGDVNTYAVFAEHNRIIIEAFGRAGFIVPPGLATDDTTKAYFQELVSTNGLVALYEFENEEFLFSGIDHRVRFIVITVMKSRPADGQGADISFGNRNIASLANASRHFSLTPADFKTLNPNTRTCPTFRSRKDADINLSMYRRAGVLWRESDTGDSNPWGLRFMAMIHMANDSSLFRDRSDLIASGATLEGNCWRGKDGRYLPLIEAKMVHHFDHRFGTYEGQTEAQENQGKLPEFDLAAHADPYRLTHPYYWVSENEVATRLQDRWTRDWLLGWRDICRSTDQRTIIASIIPKLAVNDKFLLMLPSVELSFIPALYADLSSFALDYCARQKVGGTSLKYFTMKQLPVLPPDRYLDKARWDSAVLVRDWILPRVLELTYTAWDLQAFGRDVGYDGPPFRWDPDRRFLLRCELDAAFFHLYGISRDDADYILETFPIVRKNDEKAHGEYRSKRVILDIYDELALASRTGRAYVSRLDPPPADPRVAHPASSRPQIRHIPGGELQTVE